MSDFPSIKIHGLQKLTLLDYPGKVACTIFLGGCNWRCPFCHNASLVRMDGSEVLIDNDELAGFLKKRQGLLDGVCISGGEPLLRPELADLIRSIRAMGYLIKLDTNGSKPQQLKELVREGMLDYVAMDIKNAPYKYRSTSGCSPEDLAAVQESADFLLNGSVEYEFRTTIVREMHSVRDILAIGRWLQGAEHYYLQDFTDSGDILKPGWHSCQPEEMQRFLIAVRQYIPRAGIRNI